MNYYYKSPYICHANTTINWLPMDTEDLYYENLSKNYELLRYHNWLDKKINYTFNSEGFRCEDFNEEPSIVFLGCSYTVGIGLPIEYTWAHMVSEKLKLKCYNLGIGCSSCDTAFRLGYHYINKIKPKMVIFLRPSPNRMEAINKDYPEPVIHMGLYQKLVANVNSYEFHYHSDDDNGLLNTAKNTLSLNFVCSQLNIKFHYFDIDKLPKLDLARDLGHIGFKSNSEFANKVLSVI